MKHRVIQNSATLLAVIAGAISCFPACSQNAASSPSDATLTRILKENEAKRPTEATLAELQEILAKEPKNFYARLVMGNSLDRLGLPMQAIEQYQLAVQLGPNSPKAIIELVKAQIGVGQKEAAMRLLQQATKRYPNDAEITFWVGNYFLSKGDIKSAEQYFQKAQLANVNFLGMSTSRAQIKMMQKNYTQAIALTDVDLKDNPTYPLANAIRGVSLFNLNKFKAALPNLKIAYDNYGLRDEYAKQYAEAALISAEPKSALEPAMVALAIATKVVNSEHESKWLLANVISRLPASFVREQVPVITDRIDKRMKNAPMHFAFGDIFDAYGYHDLAATQFFQCYQLDPTQASAAFRLANDLEMYFQKYDDAIVYFTKAHALSPTDAVIADRLTRLQNRLPGRDRDLAWKLKDLLRKQRSPI